MFLCSTDLSFPLLPVPLLDNYYNFSNKYDNLNNLNNYHPIIFDQNKFDNLNNLNQNKLNNLNLNSNSNSNSNLNLNLNDVNKEIHHNSTTNKNNEHLKSNADDNRINEPTDVAKSDNENYSLFNDKSIIKNSNDLNLKSNHEENINNVNNEKPPENDKDPPDKFKNNDPNAENQHSNFNLDKILENETSNEILNNKENSKDTHTENVSKNEGKENDDTIELNKIESDKNAMDNLNNSTNKNDESNETDKNNSLKRKTQNKQNKRNKSRRINGQHGYNTRSSKRKREKNENNNNKRFKSFNLDDIMDNMANYSANVQVEPENFKDIKYKTDKKEWLKAVNDELKNMTDLKVYETVNKVPKNANIITPRWVFRYKYDSDGNITKRKARLVARGFKQKFGVDYKEAFSPTLKQDSLRIISAIAAKYNYNIYQMDVKAAYLNAKLEEDIYMEAPEGDKNYKKCYWKLKKALYGLKQAGRMWNNTLNKVLIGIGFKRLRSEPCLYVKFNKRKEITCILAVYVDDILITGIEEEIIKTRKFMKEKFQITDVGKANYIIGVKFEKYKDGYLLHQKKYTNDVLKRFNIEKYTPSSNMVPVENKEMRKKKFSSTKYRRAIGSLLYLAICTRPDILFAVSKASRKSQDPTYEDWFNVLKIFRYLKDKQDYGIKFRFNNENDFEVYVDADFGGDLDTRKSTTGYVMTMGGGPTSWYSKLQRCVSTSTAESEYYALNECANHCLWYINIFKELNINIKPMIINTDNKATIYNCKNETINPKSKHIDIKYHHIRDLVREKKIDLKYIKSQDNLADGFTKYLNNTLMTKFRNNILTKF